jgi:hypothetical protein
LSRLILRPSQQPRQLRNIGRDSAGLLARQQIGRRAAAGVALEIRTLKGERLAVVVLDDEAGGVCLLNVPRRRETAGRQADFGP